MTTTYDDRFDGGAGRGAGHGAGEAPGRDDLTVSLGRPTRLPPLKRLLPRGFLGRSVLILLLPLVLLQVIATWVFYDRHYDNTTWRLAQALAGDVEVMVRLLGGEALPDTDILTLSEQVFWVDASILPDTELGESVEPRFGSILHERLHAALMERLGPRFAIDTVSREKEVLVEVDLGEDLLLLEVNRKRLFSVTTYIFLAWMIGSSIVLFIVAFLFLRIQVRAIVRLARAAESFGKGRDLPAFKPEGADEVRQAAAAFIQMRERIKRQIEQRTAMLAGVSHDLRTPLTRMKLELAMLGDSPDVASLKQDVQQMERMIEGYLAFARGEGREDVQPVDLGELLRKLAADFRREGAEVDLHVEQPVTLSLRREAIRRCLTNLIGNAHRYGGAVSVRVGKRRGGVEVLVDDDGPGVPPDKREEVFKPFVRLDSSRNFDTGGTGLGLTIARDVARGHGGDLTLDESPTGGLRARLWLPI
jgi:two-component system osmolarity sensor histidine kinase EnvZ